MTEQPTSGESRSTHIAISDRRHGLPYSKGLMASQVMVTGLSPYRAYEVAERIEQRLLERGEPTVSSEELNRIAAEVLQEVAGGRYAKNFARWGDVERLDLPLVVLIGGATGVGKSTIATQLATRLGIVRTVATDAIREVMRAVFSPELMPTLHTSSFQAGEALREPPGRSADTVIVGFREQTAAVSVGVQALLERAAVEGASFIIEGVHVVPGFLDLERWKDRVLPVPFMVAVEDEEAHRSHFAMRSLDTVGRPMDRYVRHFGDIRKIQRYIRSQALAHGVPVIPNYSLDQAVAGVIDLVVERVSDRIAMRAGSGADRAETVGGVR